MNREQGTIESIEPDKELLEVTTSIHNMPCIQIEKPTKELGDLIRKAMVENSLNEEVYHLNQDAGAFLQADDDDFILVEFWKPNYQGLVDYLNKQINLKQIDLKKEV